MSDIIYTPPSSAGTTINPTNKFIPVRSNATTFIDSCLKQQTTTMLVTSFSGNDNGLKVDGGANSYFLGNYAIGTTSYINVATGGFSYIYGGNVTGIDCSFASNQYRLGRFTGGNTTFLSINDTAQQIASLSGGVNKGILLSYSIDKYEFGGLGVGNRVTFEANNGGNIARTTQLGFDNGFRFQFGIRRYTLGQISNNNTNQLVIDDVNQQIYTNRAGAKTGISIDTNVVGIGSLTTGNQLLLGTDNAASSFIFNGTGITSGTSGGNAGHIKVLINGTPYKIAYQNP
jgi:hypothetical protein